MLLDHFTNIDIYFLAPLLVGLLAATIYRMASGAIRAVMAPIALVGLGVSVLYVIFGILPVLLGSTFANPVPESTAVSVLHRLYPRAIILASFPLNDNETLWYRQAPGMADHFVFVTGRVPMLHGWHSVKASWGRSPKYYKHVIRECLEQGPYASVACQKLHRWESWRNAFWRQYKPDLEQINQSTVPSG